MLTNAAVKAARPKLRAYKIADGQGLHLHVAPTGTKSFRLRYRDQDGREQTLTFGPVTLAEARARRDVARAQLARGEDPRTAEGAADFEAAARAWHAHHLEGWSPVHAADVLASLERNVFPAIGAAALDSVTRPAILQLLERVEARGAVESARRLRQRIEKVFEFALAKGWASIINPATVGAALANAPATGRQAALVDIGALRELVAAVDALPAGATLRLASCFLALTAVRLAALRGMRWSEIEEFDGPEPLWRVPAVRMKLGVHHKRDAANDHLVPLSPPAVDVLRAARAIVGEDVAADALVFASRAGAAPIGAGAIGELYARAGFAGRHVPHGWRASFSTVMNERRPGQRFDIDRTLGHKPKDMKKPERAYNRAQHLTTRRELLEEWAALIAPAALSPSETSAVEWHTSCSSPSPSPGGVADRSDRRAGRSGG